MGSQGSYRPEYPPFALYLLIVVADPCPSPPNSSSLFHSSSKGYQTSLRIEVDDAGPP